MISRIATSLVVVATLIIIACVDMSAPSGAASISVLLLPSPSVIVGDSMRDSLGVARPVRVTAFDADGVPLSTVEMQFFVTDTLGVAHLTPSNFLVGDKLGTTRVMGQVQTMQTPVVNIAVTHLPAKLLEGQKLAEINVPLGADSATSIGRGAITAFVKSVADSASQGIIVRYKIVRAPRTKEGNVSPAVFIAGDDGRLAFSDTSDASGAVSRSLTIVSAFLGDADLLAGRKVDTAVVDLTAMYKGQPLSGSPLRLTVPIKVFVP